MIPRLTLYEEGRAHAARRRQETADMKRQRHRGQDPTWRTRAHESDPHYVETQIGFCAHLSALVPDADAVWAWCLLRGIRYPSQWEAGRRTLFLEALLAGKLPELYDPAIDRRRGDRKKKDWRADWLAGCPTHRIAA